MQASDDYVPGQSGWVLHANGDAEFNDCRFVGVIDDGQEDATDG